jgi:hypothetical protein
VTGNMLVGKSFLQLKSIMFLTNVLFSLSFLAEEERFMLTQVAAVQISEVAQTVTPKLYVVTEMKYVLYKQFLN